MLCSRCSEIVTPVVALDIDGTLGQYHYHFHRFAEMYLQRKLEPGYDGSREMHDWYGLSLHEYRQIKLAYRQGGMKRSMPLYPAVKELVDTCRRADAEIWIATTRPFLRLDNVDPDTRFWLEHNDIPHDGLLYGDDKYDRLADAVDWRRVVAVVDDLPEQYLNANRVFGDGVGVIIKREHNKASWNVPFEWQDTALATAGHIVRKCAAWREENVAAV